MEEGKAQFEMIMKQSESPRYGLCWKEALKEVETGCRRLTDDVQSRLALNFANCHLAKLDLPTYPCSPERTVAECALLMKDDFRAFNAYTEFFTHTQSLCHFLQSQVWQEQTDLTITRLSDTSAIVADRMEETQSIQEIIIHKQNESLDKQEQILKSGHLLSQFIENSSQQVEGMFEQFKQESFEQRMILHEVFERLDQLKAFFATEFAGFYGLVFYACAIVVSFIITSTPRTASARIWMFAALSAMIVVERTLIPWSIEQNEFFAEILYHRIWLCRKGFVFLSVAMLAYSIWSYRDYERLNNDMLHRLLRMNSELKMIVESRVNSDAETGDSSSADETFSDESGDEFRPSDERDSAGSESESSLSLKDEVAELQTLASRAEPQMVTNVGYNLRRRQADGYQWSQQDAQLDESPREFFRRVLPKKRRERRRHEPTMFSSDDD